MPYNSNVQIHHYSVPIPRVKPKEVKARSAVVIDLMSEEDVV